MIAFILKVSLCWLFFYGIFELFLKKRTFFNANRSYLLITLFAGVVLPLLEFVPWKNESNVAHVIYPVLMEIDDLQAIVNANAEKTFSWIIALYIIYAAGFIISFLKLILGIRKILELYQKSVRINNDGHILVLTQEGHLPFSFFKWVFVSKKTELVDELDQVINHEIEHIKGRHSVDIILTELLKVVFWCSPMIYFYRNALKEVHEYLADHVVIKKTDKFSYKQLLLRQTNNNLQLALTHQFFNSHLKNRIKMMNQKRSGRPTLVMYALGIPVLFLLLYAFTFSIEGEDNSDNKDLIQLTTDDLQSENYDLASMLIDTVPTKNRDLVFKVVEQMPRFPGCEDMEDNRQKDDCAKKKMLEFIYTNLKYPQAARNAGIEGMVVAQFVITDKGSIKDAKIVRSVDSDIDAESLRVIEMMGEMAEKWTPGHQRGTAVNVRYTLPLRFKLDSDDKKEKNEKISISADKIKIVGKEDIVTKPYVLVDGQEYKGSLDELDSDNIASMNVLKGDSAAAIYGEKGAHGVIEIATKKAKLSKEVKVAKKEKEPKAKKGIKEPKGEKEAKVRKEPKEPKGEKELGTGSLIKISGADPLFIIDNEIQEKNTMSELNPDDIATVNVLKGEKADLKYGEKGINGVVEIITKKYAEKYKKESSLIAQEVDELPYFPGCAATKDKDEKRDCSNHALLEFIYSNLKYPKAAAKAGIEGTVVTSFTISKEGRVEDIKLKRDVDGLSKEALRVVALMDDKGVIWEPALINGQAVAAEFVLPIKYKLQDKVENKITACDDLKDEEERNKCRAEKEKLTKKALDALLVNDDSIMKSDLDLSKYSAYPNPSDGNVTVKFEAARTETSVSVFDQNGKIFWSKQLLNFDGSFEEMITFDASISKVYYLQIRQGDKITTKKILIE